MMMIAASSPDFAEALDVHRFPLRAGGMLSLI